jgi:hypothetical protein
MNQLVRRKRLTPWYIGIVIILAAVGYVGYQMLVVPGCAVPAALGLVILIVIPVVYLVLMYLTLTSQD